MHTGLLRALMDITGTLLMLVLLMDTMVRSGLAAVSLLEPARGTAEGIGITGAAIAPMIAATGGTTTVGMGVVTPTATIGTTTGMTTAGVIMIVSAAGIVTISAAENMGMAEGSFEDCLR